MAKLSNPIRIMSLIVGLSSILATLILVVVREPVQGADGTYLSTIWALLRYFTILTNAIVSYVLIRATIQGYWYAFSLLTGATLWICLVGVIYHSMLAGEHNPEGLASLTNHIHHTLVPFGTFMIWLWTKNRTFVPAKSPFIWLAFPLIYSLYTIFRAHFMGDVYPYGFSDPTQVGWKTYFVTQLILIAVFLGLGFVFRWVSNKLIRNESSRTPTID